MAFPGRVGYTSGVLARVALLAALLTPARAAGWKLAYEEKFASPIPESGEWAVDPLDGSGPWATDHLGDAGRFFDLIGGEDFRRQLRSFKLMRKRVAFGKDGWLTAELAARDADGDGAPDSPPRLLSRAGRATLSVDDATGALLVRSTRPLPPRYRVEVQLSRVDFGGSRGGSWERGGRVNGYRKSGVQTSHPWLWGPDPAFGKSADAFPDVRSANGFYYLAVVDYADPAPHNNVFIHTHRKAVIDSYNVTGAGRWQVCDPKTKALSTSDDNVLHMFFPTVGNAYESKAVMKTECGTFVGGEDGAPSYVGVGKVSPGGSYAFAIERDAQGYVLEAEGEFGGKRRRLRYRRDFAEDGRPVWHYNQAAAEYDGRFDAPWTYKGPHGELTVPHSWPKGSAYPDYFILGDPHLNFYAGTAEIRRIALLVPDEKPPATAAR